MKSMLYFRHYKGDTYTQICRGKRELDREPWVGYAAADGEVWFRPAVEFDEKFKLYQASCHYCGWISPIADMVQTGIDHYICGHEIGQAQCPQFNKPKLYGPEAKL